MIYCKHQAMLLISSQLIVSVVIVLLINLVLVKSLKIKLSDS